MQVDLVEQQMTYPDFERRSYDVHSVLFYLLEMEIFELIVVNFVGV